MDLLDRYILAVKQALPRDKQTEIGRELRANLQDEIDACAETLANDTNGAVCAITSTNTLSLHKKLLD